MSFSFHRRRAILLRFTPREVEVHLIFSTSMSHKNLSKMLMCVRVCVCLGVYVFEEMCKKHKIKITVF